MPNFLKGHRVKVTPLTPVHVGSGETLEPFEYHFQGNEVWVLSPMRLLEVLRGPELDRYLNALERGPFAAREVLHEIARGTDLRPAIAWRAPVGQGFARYLEEALEKRRGELSLRVFPRALEGPYLPGSSLKGALRTVFLFDQTRGELAANFDEEQLVWTGDYDLVWQTQDRNLWPGQWRKVNGLGRIRAPWNLKRPARYEKRDAHRVNVRFESHLLKNLPQRKGDADILRDPLRTLAVTDSAPLPKTEFRLLEVYGSKRNAVDATGIRLLAESWVEGSAFAELRFHIGLQTNPHSLINQNGSQPPLPKLADIAAASYERYVLLAEAELDFYEERGWTKASRKMESVLEAIAACLNEDGTMKKPFRFPLRLGFGASELAMRLSEFIEYVSQRGRARIHPVSRKLAEGEPMGWVMVEVLE